MPSVDLRKLSIVNLVALAVSADASVILSGLIPHLIIEKHESNLESEALFFDSIILKTSNTFKEIHKELNDKEKCLKHNRELFDYVVEKVKSYEDEALAFLNNFKLSSSEHKDFYKQHLISKKIYSKHFNSNSFLLSFALLVSITKAKESDLDIEDLLDELLSKHIYEFYKNFVEEKLSNDIKNFPDTTKTRIRADMAAYDVCFKKIIPSYSKYKLRENLKRSIMANKLKFDSAASFEVLSKLPMDKLEYVVKQLGFYLSTVGDYDSLVFEVRETSVVSVVDNVPQEVIKNLYDI